MIGRSNVGKSSLLNALAGRKIAKVSATPGKTRALNVFLIAFGSREQGAVPGGPERSPGSRRRVPLPAPRSLYVLDLPGYGYSRAAKQERVAFRRLVAHTLERPRVAGVLWLLDIRREPSDDDLAMQDVLTARGTRVLAAVTKSDKLPRGQRMRRGRALREALALDEDQVIATSARTGEGVTALREAIAALVRSEHA
ncbi:MAG TPA: GTP-binding protein 8 [Gemmatimonadales bacterium]|nr:GTP-binding protein 8 [Gemmatimonadales bacterium]